MGENARLTPEQKVFIRHTGRSDLGGTADIVIHSPTEIEVIDYKSGIGIYVPPEVPQLKLCALGVLEVLPGDISLGTPVKLTIVQPRYPSGPPIRSIETTVAELQNYRDYTVAIRADMTDNPNVEGEPSEKACRFCAAKKTEYIDGFNQSHCVEYDKAIVDSITGMFTPIQDVEPRMILKHQESVLYDNNALSKILLMLPVIRNYCDDLEEHAIEIIKKGEKVPLQKVIATSGRRGWLNPDDVDTALNRTAIKKTSYVSKLKTPKQIMDQKMSKDLRKKLEGLIGSSSGGVKLVHQDDPHKSIVPDFQPIVENSPVSFTPITEDTSISDLPSFLQ